jgi:hypothetical protein
MEVITIDDLLVVDYGVWRGVGDAVNAILSVLARRSYERRQDLDYERDFDVYFCPRCTYAVRTTRLAVQRRGVPKCPLHGVDAVKFSRRAFFARERELFERLESRLGGVLAVFAEAAEAYAGRPPLEWRLRIPPVVELKPNADPTVFRYVPWDDAVDAVFYYLEVPRQKRAFEILMRGALRLGLAFHAVVHYADEPPPGAVRDGESGIYVVYAGPEGRAPDAAT